MIGASQQRRRQLLPFSDRHRVALERLFDRISDLSTLPSIAQEIFRVANQPDANVDDLREVIQRDVALAASVLRRANSAFFGGRVKVSDLRAAIAMLGFREIRSLCLTVFVSRMFDRPGKYRGYTRENLWRHCVATAIIARKIARVSDRLPPDEAYVAGLLHHVGTILLDQHLRGQFCDLIERLDEMTPTYLVEREVFSFDQGQLGEYVLTRWNFPEQICEAVRYYRYPDIYDGPNRALVNTVALANFLASCAGWTSLGIQNVEMPQDETYAALGLDRHVVPAIWDDLQSSLAEQLSI
jgi:HD-like signal output (HDOD) protein